MDHRLLEIVACPSCQGKVFYNRDNNELICKFDRVAYPIVDGIPVLIESEARDLSQEEVQG